MTYIVAYLQFLPIFGRGDRSASQIADGATQRLVPFPDNAGPDTWVGEDSYLPVRWEALPRTVLEAGSLLRQISGDASP